MRYRLPLLALAVAVALPTVAAAQLGRWESEEPGQFEEWIEMGRFRPFLEANYGLAKPRFEGLADSFNTLGLVEVKLGYAALDSVRPDVVSLDERYIFASYLAEDLRSGGTEADGDVPSKLTRFGGGNRLGYGFGGHGFAFELYNQNSMNWTELEPVAYDETSPEAQAIFDRYGSSLRFGQLYEAGAKFQLARSFSLSIGAEGAVIYPRHVFWPWLGSAAIYSGVQGGLQYFSKSIVDTSPIFGPLLHFVLKTGVSLGYYLLSREDMNWPFESETPLTVESLKLGASLTF